jgi:hypothetical protein
MKLVRLLRATLLARSGITTGARNVTALMAVPCSDHPRLPLMRRSACSASVQLHRLSLSLSAVSSLPA